MAAVPEVAVAGVGVAQSCALTAKLNVPAELGVPLMTPVPAFCVMPVGSAPLAMVQLVYPGLAHVVPPVAQFIIGWLYVVDPAVVAGSPAATTVNEDEGATQLPRQKSGRIPVRGSQVGFAERNRRLVVIERTCHVLD